MPCNLKVLIQLLKPLQLSSIVSLLLESFPINFTPLKNKQKQASDKIYRAKFVYQFLYALRDRG
jgi:hypothetical protein